MVLLVEKFAKLYSKLEKRHHHNDLPPQPEELSSNSNSLLAFKSLVSKFISQSALLDSKPAGSEEIILSLSWIGRCFSFLPMINKAFAKLLVDINYPMSKWEVGSIELYLNYSLCLLKILNSVSSSLSRVGHAWVSLAHGLTMVEYQNSPSLETEHLKSIQPGSFSFSFRSEFGNEFFSELSDKVNKPKIFDGKERVVHEVVKEMQGIGFWVCGVLLSGLHSDCKPYTEIRKIAGGYDSSSSVFVLDRRISERLLLPEKMPILFSEMKKLNIAVADIVVVDSDDEVMGHDAMKEVKTKLHDLGTILDGMSKEVDDLFANVMAQRSELIDCFRFKTQHKESTV